MKSILLVAVGLSIATALSAGLKVGAERGSGQDARGGDQASAPGVRLVSADPMSIASAEELEDADNVVATLPPDGEVAAAVVIDLGTTSTSDGAFNPPSGTTTINLGNAASGNTCDCNGDGVFDELCRWDCDAQNDPADLASGKGGRGVYDPEKWAVVFKYSSVTVQSGRTINFANHPSRAPVVWLVQGNVSIAGSISLNGNNGIVSAAGVEPGPGGFRGGRGAAAAVGSSAGHGPGGGGRGGHGSAGSYGSQGQGDAGNLGLIYGFPGAYPLFGGSGGGGSDSGPGGGAGGGAILIGSTMAVIISGTIHADGGYGAYNGSGSSYRTAGGGSGGTIRIVADTISGPSSGVVRTKGNTNNSRQGGSGRIRLEANQINFLGTIDGTPVTEALLALVVPPSIWGPSGTPTIKATKIITGVGDHLVPSDPRASFVLPEEDVLIDSDAPVTVEIEANNVPLDWTVKVRVVAQSGPTATFNAQLISGDQNASIWRAQATLARGFSALQVRAAKP